MYLRLKIQTAPEAPWTTREFEGATVRVGRDPGLELAFDTGEPSQRVSYEHAVFELRPEGLFVRDLNSKNGTYVAEEPVREQQLRVGNVISLGRKGPKLRVLDFRLPAPDASPPRPVADDRDARRAPAAVHAPVIAALPDRAAQQVVGNPAPLPEPRPPDGGRKGAWGSTRRYVMEALQRHTLRWKVLAGVSALMLSVALVAIFWPAAPDNTGERIQRQLLRATVLVHCKADNAISSGSGALIDAERRLIVTNYHVVRDANHVEVYAPSYDASGKLRTDSEHYQDRMRAGDGFPAKVLLEDRERDLAILQIDATWKDVAPLTLARSSAEAGQRVHSMGNPGFVKTNNELDLYMWVYTSGTVRQLRQERIEFTDPAGRDWKFSFYAVLTQSPTNHGDSGGPLVNDRGELVGVTHGADLRAELMNKFIDVSEVRHVLSRLP